MWKLIMRCMQDYNCTINRTMKMATVHFTTIPCEPNIHSQYARRKLYIFGQFIAVLTLSVLSLELLEHF